MPENNWVLNDSFPTSVSQQFEEPVLESSNTYWGPGFLAFNVGEDAGAGTVLDSSVALPMGSTTVLAATVTLTQSKALPFQVSGDIENGRLHSTVALPFGSTGQVAVLAKLDSSKALPFGVFGEISGPQLSSSVRLPFGVSGYFEFPLLFSSSVQLPFNLGRDTLVTAVAFEPLVTVSGEPLVTAQFFPLSNATISTVEPSTAKTPWHLLINTAA
jgi:hypothetical protein